jgi:hypothetical protein
MEATSFSNEYRSSPYLHILTEVTKLILHIHSSSMRVRSVTFANYQGSLVSLFKSAAIKGRFLGREI